MHILPQLRKLEEQFGDELVVIGVHAGKFIAERRTENIRHAVERLGVVHPVVNDRQFRTWRAYAVGGWPTLTLIDPTGRVLAQEAGEMPAESIAEAVEQVIEEAEAAGTLERGRVPGYLERQGRSAGEGGRSADEGGRSKDGVESIGVTVSAEAGEPGSDPVAQVSLRYPGQLLADEASGRLFIADTGNHRILVARLGADGSVAEVEAVFGGGGSAPDGGAAALASGEMDPGDGAAGFADGSTDQARFRDPHGMALEGRTLYVADTGNHAIRAIDLESGEVRTVVGTGEQGRMAAWRALEGVDTEDAAAVEASRPSDWWLNSPWDVVVHDGALYIAIAGSHQIWRLDPQTGKGEAWAGSGAEDLRDGPREEALLSQPSGLSSDGRRLFFADAEDSGVRWVDFGPPGKVHTIVGTGLFDFGDRDGTGDDVRLQHPQDVAWHAGALYVADTYNDKIKVVDPETRSARSWVGGEGVLHEPGGVSVAGGQVYIADTNAHRVVVAEVGGEGLRELEIVWG